MPPEENTNPALVFRALDEEEARRLVFVRAVEESEGDLLSAAERQRATRLSSDEGEEGTGLLLRRAELLMRDVRGSWPEAEARRDALRPRRLGPLLVAGALVGGLSTNLVGRGQEINVLATPLLTLVAWNLFVFLFLPVVKRLFSAGATPSAGFPSGLFGPLGRFSRLTQGLAAESPTRAGILRRYARDWWELARPLVAVRAERSLHLAAAALVAGMVIGLYVRGLALDYTATWHSTFLDREGVESVLHVALAPGRLFLPFPELKTMGEPMDAAPWIHLYALTAALVVIVPRLLLALRAAARARRIGADFPLALETDPYVTRLFAPQRGGGVEAVVTAFSFSPSARVSETLEELLLDHLGNRARIVHAAGVPYGAGGVEDGEAHPEAKFDLRVVLFNLAQSPEQEVHGPFLEEERARAAATEDGGQLLVVISEDAFRQRMGEGDEGARRMEERRRSWRRVLEACGLSGLFWSANGHAASGGADAALVRLRECVAPEAAPLGGRAS